MKRYIVLVTLLMASLVLGSGTALGGNIDPDDDGSQYAWGENVGWLNFEPAEGPGVTITDTDVIGYVWAENIVRNFSRYHKYTLGRELREKSREIVGLIIKTNSTKEGLPKNSLVFRQL
jgi:hypothetical protein